MTGSVKQAIVISAQSKTASQQQAARKQAGGFGDILRSQAGAASPVRSTRPEAATSLVSAATPTCPETMPPITASAGALPQDMPHSEILQRLRDAFAAARHAQDASNGKAAPAAPVPGTPMSRPAVAAMPEATVQIAARSGDADDNRSGMAQIESRIAVPEQAEAGRSDPIAAVLADLNSRLSAVAGKRSDRAAPHHTGGPVAKNERNASGAQSDKQPSALSRGHVTAPPVHSSEIGRSIGVQIGSAAVGSAQKSLPSTEAISSAAPSVRRADDGVPALEQDARREQASASADATSLAGTHAPDHRSPEVPAPTGRVPEQARDNTPATRPLRDVAVAAVPTQAKEEPAMTSAAKRPGSPAVESGRFAAEDWQTIDQPRTPLRADRSQSERIVSIASSKSTTAGLSPPDPMIGRMAIHMEEQWPSAIGQPEIEGSEAAVAADRQPSALIEPVAKRQPAIDASALSAAVSPREALRALLSQIERGPETPDDAAMPSVAADDDGPAEVPDRSPASTNEPARPILHHLFGLATGSDLTPQPHAATTGPESSDDRSVEAISTGSTPTPLRQEDAMPTRDEAPKSQKLDAGSSTATYADMPRASQANGQSHSSGGTTVQTSNQVAASVLQSVTPDPVSAVRQTAQAEGSLPLPASGEVEHTPDQVAPQPSRSAASVQSVAPEPAPTVRQMARTEDGSPTVAIQLSDDYRPPTAAAGGEPITARPTVPDAVAAPNVRVEASQSFPIPAAPALAASIDALGWTLAAEPSWKSVAASHAGFQSFASHTQPRHASTLRIELKPVELGAVTANLKLAGDHLTVEIAVENQEAYNRLSQERDTIVQSLRGLGLQVDQITIQQPQAAYRSDQNLTSFGNGARDPGSPASDQSAGGQGQPGSRNPSGGNQDDGHRPTGQARRAADGGSDIYI